MKKLITLVFVLFLVLLPSVVLAADPETTPDTSINVTVTTDQSIDATINLTGSELDVSVNGIPLNALIDRQTLMTIGGGMMFDVHNLIMQLQTLEDTYNQKQDSTINLYGSAIAKLINDLTILNNTLKDQTAFSASNISDLQDKYIAIKNYTDSLSKLLAANDAKTQQGLKTLSDVLVALQSTLETLKQNTAAAIVRDDSEITALKKEQTVLKIKADTDLKITIIASVVAAIALILGIIALAKKSVKTHPQRE